MPGPISTKEISGGVKTLILMAFDKSVRIFNASSCGDSATGKTKLINLLEQAAYFGEGSGVEVICERPCRTLGGRDRNLVLPNLPLFCG